MTSLISNRTKQFLRGWGLVFLSPMLPLSLLRLPRFFAEFFKFKISSQQSTGPFVVMPRLSDCFPCLHDRTKATPFDGHYFYQGAWLGRRLKEARFSGKHVDVGSSIMSISVLSAFVDTIFVDYRPLQVHLDNLHCIAGDISALPFATNSIESVSCLHVIEHIGLGRYGDPLDPLGHIKAASELQRIVKPGGRLYITTPVGNERVCFNGHRIFNPISFCSMFPEMDLASFSFVDDRLDFHTDGRPEDARTLDYGCGLFEFRKKSASQSLKK